MRKCLTLLSVLSAFIPCVAHGESGPTVQAILGKTLESPHVKQAHIYADGTLDGVFNGISYAGVWTLEDGRYCRELTRGLISERACLDLKPIMNETGDLIAVIFKASGVETRFEVN